MNDADIPTPASTPGHAPHCGYCDTPLCGPYCHACGLRAPKGRLNFRDLLAEFGERVLDIERGLVRTLWHLLTRPRTVLQAFLAGRRRYYTHPLSFVLVLGTLSLLFWNLWLGEAFWNEFRQVMNGYAGTHLNEIQRQRFADFYVGLSRLLPYWMMGFTLPSALLARWLFRRRAHTVAEFWMVLLYAVGAALVIDIPIGAIAHAFGLPLSGQMMFTNCVMILSQASLLAVWLGVSLRTIAVSLLVTLLSFALAGMAQQSAALTYAYWPVR